MLDAIIRKRIDPALAVIARHALKWRISATTATVAGFVLGLMATALVVSQLYLAAAAVLLLSRFLDGLDGAIARQSRVTDLGGFLDIVLDFVVYVLALFSFALAAPAVNALAAAFVIVSFVMPTIMASAYAATAAKRGSATDIRGSGVLYYVSGLSEGTETIVCLVLMCVFPEWFSTIAVVYAVMCWIAAGAWIAAAVNTFGDADKAVVVGATQ